MLATLLAAACVTRAPGGSSSGSGSDTEQAADLGVEDEPVADLAVEDSASEEPISIDLPSEDRGTPDSGGPEVGESDRPSFRLASFNLHNFSQYGDREYRIDDIAGEIAGFRPDILGLQELEPEEGSDGSFPQAWDALLEELPDYEGVHATWDFRDTTVGLFYRTDTVTLDDWEVIFEDDWSAFPRPPLVAHVTVRHESSPVSFTVIVVHLKAFGDSVDRRRDACEKLVEYIEDRPGQSFVIIGDMNDDPYDPAGENSFDGTFLGNPDYVFITADLPPESVSSTGYHHYVGDEYIEGEFLDHAIATAGFYAQFDEVTPAILGRPTEELSDWVRNVSDHFPLVIDFD
jgi:endonuclease/exonuclease/phosphatase family metal-dependent hydrolase